MSNVKAGDLAIIINARKAFVQPYLGHMVRVLDVAPEGEVPLPDGGRSTHGNGFLSWVCEASTPWTVPNGGGGTRQTRYVVIADRCLMPLRDPDADTEASESEELSPAVSRALARFREALAKNLDATPTP